MQVHNMLEKNGSGYVNGNIKLVRIKPEKITVYLRGGAALVYKITQQENSEAVCESS